MTGLEAPVIAAIIGAAGAATGGVAAGIGSHQAAKRKKEAAEFLVAPDVTNNESFLDKLASQREDANQNLGGLSLRPGGRNINFR